MILSVYLFFVIRLYLKKELGNNTDVLQTEEITFKR